MKKDWRYRLFIRHWHLLRTIQTIAQCRVWMLYVRDPMTLTLIKVLHHGATLAYGLLKYKWMPSYKGRV
jgi:hypothetical protein